MKIFKTNTENTCMIFWGVLLLSVFSGISCYAQQSLHVTYEAEIENVPENGYYSIELNHEMIAIAKDDHFSELRIIGNRKEEIPYFVYSELPVKEINTFIEYKLKLNSAKDSVNIIIIEKPDSVILNSLCLGIVSADVSKFISIQGSNDEKQWYIVKQKEEVNHRILRQNGIEYLMLHFPDVNYKYYKITLTNPQDTPLKVLKAGTFEHSNIYASEKKNDLGGFFQKDSSDKRTYIYFPFSEYKYKINKISFQVDNKTDYLRKAFIKDRYGSSFNLSSRKDNIITFDNPYLLSCDTIVIENNDNPFLKIDSVETFGLNRYLCAYLEKDNKYILTIDKKNTSIPQYDIEHFKNDIPSNIPILKILVFKKLDNHVEDNNRGQMWIEKPTFLWLSISTVGLLLILLCWKIINDMKKRQ